MIGDYGATYYDTAYCIVNPIRGGIVGRCAYGLLVQSSVDAFEIPGFAYIWFEAWRFGTAHSDLFQVHSGCVDVPSESILCVSQQNTLVVPACLPIRYHAPLAHPRGVTLVSREVLKKVRRSIPKTHQMKIENTVFEACS
jgi:hypothetical protein